MRGGANLIPTDDVTRAVGTEHGIRRIGFERIVMRGFNQRVGFADGRVMGEAHGDRAASVRRRAKRFGIIRERAIGARSVYARDVALRERRLRIGAHTVQIAHDPPV